MLTGIALRCTSTGRVHHAHPVSLCMRASSYVFRHDMGVLE